ncbi:MAG: hypothetical protein NPIRA01_17410 [Nitrospirales bacterium]|nr:MAG: hypothetical protein NPIRA01_17410 [Nitrospirales bacterium]
MKGIFHKFLAGTILALFGFAWKRFFLNMNMKNKSIEIRKIHKRDKSDEDQKITPLYRHGSWYW